MLAHASQLASLDVAPQRHQQFAGECYHHDLADASFGPAGAFDEPATERAVRLEAQLAPCQLHQKAAHSRIAVLADALLAFHPTAVGAARCNGARRLIQINAWPEHATLTG